MGKEGGQTQRPIKIRVSIGRFEEKASLGEVGKHTEKAEMGRLPLNSPEQRVLGSTSPGLLLESGELRGICQKGRNPGCRTGKQLPIRFKGKNAANR